MRHLHLLLLLVGSVFQGCAAGHHYKTDAATFVELARVTQGTVSACSFIGSVDGRAYLLRWSNMPWLFGGGDDIYSVALDELPPEIVEQIRAGKNPWAW
jgi:hypothetical protein